MQSFKLNRTFFEPPSIDDVRQKDLFTYLFSSPHYGVPANEENLTTRLFSALKNIFETLQRKVYHANAVHIVQAKILIVKVYTCSKLRVNLL